MFTHTTTLKRRIWRSCIFFFSALSHTFPHLLSYMFILFIYLVHFISYVFTHLFIQLIFTEHQLYARHHCRHWEYSNKKKKTVPQGV